VKSEWFSFPVRWPAFPENPGLNKWLLYNPSGLVKALVIPARMTSKKTVTLKDIAQEAGVSLMTVSRALRNQSNLSSATRAKVQQIAKKLGYRPNPLVSALMSYRRAARPVRQNLSLGFITNFPAREGWRVSKIYEDFHRGAAESADRHGYRLEEFWLRSPGMTSERMSSILYHRNISGLVIAPLPVSLGHLRLDWEQFSAVTFGYSLARPLLHRAVNHQFRSMRLAMRRLRRLGYRRIGLAMAASYDQRVDHHWVGSYLGEQHHYKPAEQVPLLVIEDEDWNEATFATWFKQHRPDVIISQQEEILNWLKNLGRKVPGDVGFAHLNAPDAAGTFGGIHQNGVVVGSVAVDFLVGMINRNERGIPELAHSILVEGTWVDGRTLQRPVTPVQEAVASAG
jgi:DNA-binding LacI/PurR family transcriptional regulator